MNTLYKVRRVYPNGSSYNFTFTAQKAGEEIRYSIKNRPGVALFLNNVCIQEGNMDKEVRELMLARIEKEMAAGI